MDVVKTFEGQQELVYNPSVGTETLKTIEFDNSYKVYANTDFAMYIVGYEPTGQELRTRLYKGQNNYFNFLGYPATVEIDVEKFFSSIKDRIVIVKDGKGNFWIPGTIKGNGIGKMQPGTGYEVAVNADVEFVIPIER